MAPSSSHGWIKTLTLSPIVTLIKPSRYYCPRKQNPSLDKIHHRANLIAEASNIITLLDQTTEELDSINALSGGYVPAKLGGDLLHDGTSVLPTGWRWRADTKIK